MSFKKNITNFLINRGFLDSESIKGKSFTLGGNSSFVLWKKNKKISAAKIMEEYKNWPYTAAKAIGENVAKIELKLKKVNRDGSSEEVTEHELLDDLGAMNKFQTGYEVIFSTAVSLAMAGNAYWFLDGVKSETDKPTQIFSLLTKDVQVLRGKFPELVKGYRVQHDGNTAPTDYTPEQILHFKVPDPNDQVEGLGTVAAIAAWIDEDNNATDFNRMFFKQGARLGGFLLNDKITTKEQLEYLAKSFEAAYSGVRNAHKPVALPAGTKFEAGQQNQKELDFVEGQKITRDKILAGFRVPKTMLGAAESDTNRATAEAARAMFLQEVVKPYMELIVMWLNEFLVPRYGEDLYIDFEDPTPANKEDIREDMKAATGSQPVMSINEAREKYTDLGPIKGGDSVVRNIALVTVGSPEEAKSSGGQRVKNVNKKNKKTIRTKAAKNMRKRKEMSDDFTKSVLNEIEEEAKAKKKAMEKAQKSITTMTDDEFEPIWKAFVTRVTPFEEKMAEIVRDFNKKQEKAVIENLENAIKAIDEKELFDEKEWTNIMIDSATPLEVEVYLQEIAAATALLGFTDITGLTPAAKEGLDRAISLMAQKYNETTLGLLKERLEKGLDEGMSFEDLKGEIRSIYEFSNETRAAQVARTEVFRTANYATRQGWIETDVVKTIKWYTAADERVCQFCYGMHGKVIRVEEKFFEKGDEVIGLEGGKLSLEYDDIQDPPLHVGCRCYTRPEKIEI